MKIVPRNKQLRAIMGGCVALSAVMVGPILVDASAQATPQTMCLPGGACLTSAGTTTVTMPVTTTTTTTAPGVTTTVPVTTTQTVTRTNTRTTTRTVTQTVTSTTTLTATVTVTTTDFSTTAVPTTTTTTTTVSAAPGVRPNTHGKPATTTVTTTGTAQCEPPGQTTSLGNGEVETCGPARGEIAVYPTTPGLYSTIFANDGNYYVSVGIFAPQFRFGHLFACYYVPNKDSVTDPGQTSSPENGVIANAVAFGKHRSDVSRPVPVSRNLCGTR
jgi:hypothetical protein